MITVVGVRFRTAGKVYYFDPGELAPVRDSHVIVETAQGIEYGTVVLPRKEVADEKVTLPLKKILRMATDKDEETEKAASKKKTSSAPTPTPRPLATYTPSKESSLKGKETDPYEAHLYDDPDEYADRYAEEFAEEIGEDTDEGYWEAYDHWNYWHDMHD